MTGMEAIRDHETRMLEASARDFAARLRAAEDTALVMIRELADYEISRRLGERKLLREAEA